jgi:hypothetical protein
MGGKTLTGEEAAEEQSSPRRFWIGKRGKGGRCEEAPPFIAGEGGERKLLCNAPTVR